MTKNVGKTAFKGILLDMTSRNWEMGVRSTEGKSQRDVNYC